MPFNITIDYKSPDSSWYTAYAVVVVPRNDTPPAGPGDSLRLGGVVLPP